MKNHFKQWAKYALPTCILVALFLTTVRQSLSLNFSETEITVADARERYNRFTGETYSYRKQFASTKLNINEVSSWLQAFRTGSDSLVIAIGEDAQGNFSMMLMGNNGGDGDRAYACSIIIPCPPLCEK